MRENNNFKVPGIPQEEIQKVREEGKIENKVNEEAMQNMAVGDGKNLNSLIHLTDKKVEDDKKIEEIRKNISEQFK